jgi:non-specific serine/threonine protein kinase/serine/threonine-protein kinase
MQQETWQEIKRLFNVVVELPPSERSTFLDAACGDQALRREVEKMLAADSSTALEQSPLVPLLEDDYSHFAGRKLGRYRILHEVGRGGMGAVFAAMRDDGEFEQQVAIKVIKGGPNAANILRHFRRERQILASLEHPNIARLLDGGMSEDGLPFYVMEFVEGEHVDEYCRARNLGVSERLGLFRQICAAVSYAHGRLIVHRDLKPSNILVTKSGQVKLLDFGIATVLSQGEAGTPRVATMLGLMTPDYASPEQFRGETVTTATDVYSLGVVLYELLAGSPPYDLTGLRLDEMLRVVCETEPSRPSAAGSMRSTASNGRTTAPGGGGQRAKFLKGDLDNIVLKALKKLPERRYVSVEQFSEDVRRHLEGLPISARPDTFAYRASKFVQRNKVGAVAASLIFLALVGGILGTTHQARVARRERERAEKRFEQVRKLANNVVFKYHDAIATLPGATATREMLVKDAIEYLDILSRDAQDNPSLARELALAYLKIGNVQGEAYSANVGDSGGALVSYRKSLEILDHLARENPARVEYLKDLHQASQATANLLVRLQYWKEAEEMGDRQLSIGQRMVELEPGSQEYRNLLARSYQIKGETAEFSGGDEETIRWYRQSLQEAERAVENDPSGELARRVLAVALQRLGTRLEYHAATMREVGEPGASIAPLYAEAEQMHRRAFNLAEGLRRDFPQNSRYGRYVAAANLNLGTALARIGKGDEGMPHILRSLETLRGISESDPKNNEAKRDVAELWQYMAFAREAMGQPDEAIEANRRSLKILVDITANDHSNFEFLKQTHSTYNNTGDILIRQGKLAEALDYYQRGMAYVAKMSAVNESPQIAVLRSESNRKIGEAYLALAEGGGGHPRALEEAHTHLLRAREDLMALRLRQELSKNYEHKLNLIDREIEKAAGRRQ